MSSSRKYARLLKRSAFERVSVLVLLALLTGALSGGAVGLIAGHAFSSSSSTDSSTSTPRHP